jgi:hypothetical protein
VRPLALLALALLVGCPAEPPTSPAFHDAWADLRPGDYAVYRAFTEGLPETRMRYEVVAVDAVGVDYTITSSAEGLATSAPRPQRRAFRTAPPGPPEGSKVDEKDEPLEAAGRTWATRRYEMTDAEGATTTLWFARGVPVFLGWHPQHGGAVKADSRGFTSELVEAGHASVAAIGTAAR